MKNNPYENNDYLKNNNDLVKEMLFFKKFSMPMEPEEEQKEDSSEKDDNER